LMRQGAQTASGHWNSCAILHIKKLEEFNCLREGPLDDPSSSVMWVAVIAATGGHIVVRVGGPHRQQSALGQHLGKWPCWPRCAGAVTADISGGFGLGAVLLFHTRQFLYHDQMVLKGQRGLFNCKVSINAIVLCLLHGIGKRLWVCTRTMEYVKIE
jgi:hypothetical protein